MCWAELLSRVWLFDPMDCIPPGSSAMGILQARILELVAMLSSRGYSQVRNQTQVFHISGRFSIIWDTREAQVDTSYIHIIHYNWRLRMVKSDAVWKITAYSSMAHIGCISAILLCNATMIVLNLVSAAAAKLLQSCLILCNPIDGSPPGSAVSGILQARTLKWVAISFSNAWKWKVKMKSLSHVQLLTTP